MTEKNVYGISAEVGYQFDKWEWDGEVPTNLIERLSVQAGKLVLQEMARDAHIWLREDNNISVIELSCFDGQVRLVYPLSEALEQWVTSHASGPADDIHPDDARELLAALEPAVAKIKAHIRR